MATAEKNSKLVNKQKQDNKEERVYQLTKKQLEQHKDVFIRLKDK